MRFGPALFCRKTHCSKFPLQNLEFGRPRLKINLLVPLRKLQFQQPFRFLKAKNLKFILWKRSAPVTDIPLRWSRSLGAAPAVKFSVPWTPIFVRRSVHKRRTRRFRSQLSLARKNRVRLQNFFHEFRLPPWSLARRSQDERFPWRPSSKCGGVAHLLELSAAHVNGSAL